MYDFLLKKKMQEEIVKECLAKWMQNFGFAIEVDAWSQIWKNNIKMTTSIAFKENLHKMFYRGYLSPERL